MHGGEGECNALVGRINLDRPVGKAQVVAFPLGRVRVRLAPSKAASSARRSVLAVLDIQTLERTLFVGYVRALSRVM